MMAKRIVRDHLRILIVVCQRVRARPDQRHITPQDIYELGKLIDTRPSEPRADPGDTLIATHRLLHHRPVVQARHAPEFQDFETAAAEANSRLLEEDGTLAVELDGDS